MKISRSQAARVLPFVLPFGAAGCAGVRRLSGSANRRFDSFPAPAPAPKR